jgi:hypothetical protein
MELYRYTLTVSDSTLDYIHGFTHEIVEYYIPAFDITFNFENGLNILKNKRFPDKNTVHIINVNTSLSIVLDQLYDLFCEETTLKNKKILAIGRFQEEIKRISE